MEEDHTQPENDRRVHLRTDDEIYLEYRQLSSGESKVAIAEFESQAEGYFNPINQLQALTISTRPLLNQIKTRDPIIYEYIVAIDEKIQLLTHAISHDREGISPNENVNISAGGISFNSDDTFEVGTQFEITIVIVNAYLHIRALGSVVYCRSEPNEAGIDKKRVGIEFSHLHDSDRQVLLEYIVDREN